MSDGQERKPVHDELHGLITCVFCDAIRSMARVDMLEPSHEDKWTCTVCGASAFVPKGEVPNHEGNGP